MSLKAPTDEDLKSLKEFFNWDEDDRRYWDNMVERCKAKIHDEDYAGLFDFYCNERQSKNHKVNVEYRFKSTLGYLSHKIAEHLLTDPLERSLMCIQSADWYHEADELAGCYTDNALGQSEACAGVAHYRIQAGLDDKVTQMYADRRHELLREFFGEKKYIMVSKDEAEKLRPKKEYLN